MRPFNLLILTNPPRTPALLMGGVKSQLRFHQLIVFLNLVVQSHLCLCFLTQIYVHTSTLITVQVIIVSEGLRHTNLSRQRHRLAYPGQLGQPICDSALKNTSEAVTSFQGANNTGEAEASPHWETPAPTSPNTVPCFPKGTRTAPSPNQPSDGLPSHLENYRREPSAWPNLLFTNIPPSQIFMHPLKIWLLVTS